MTVHPGIVPEDVLEALKDRVKDQERNVYTALVQLSCAEPSEIADKLTTAMTANNVLINLGQMVQWQMSLHKDAAEAKRQGREGVLQ